MVNVVHEIPSGLRLRKNRVPGPRVSVVGVCNVRGGVGEVGSGMIVMFRAGRVRELTCSHDSSQAQTRTLGSVLDTGEVFQL